VHLAAHAVDNPAMRAHLRCHRCDWVGELSSRQACERCGATLEVGYDGPWSDWADGAGVWRYRGWLPVAGDGVTLGEGGTPLVPSRALGPSVLLKDEGENPTRSFKDRPVAVATAMALELGAAGLLCASTGNTAVSVAAYGAHVGLPVQCLVPDGTPRDKLEPIAAAGARLRPVTGTYSDAHRQARELAERTGWANLTTTYVNPFMLEGDKTLGLELFEQLGRAPDAVVVPVGAGPLLAGIFKAFAELRAAGRWTGDGPRLFAVQAAGCAPIARAFEEGAPVRAWERPDTTAGAIADPLAGYVADGDRTLAAVRASGGAAIAVDDDELTQAARDLADADGIAVELSAAAAAAGWRRLRAQGRIAAEDVTVLVLTAADRRAGAHRAAGGEDARDR
jgi:threonine synthase